MSDMAEEWWDGTQYVPVPRSHARMQEGDQKIADLQAELDKAHRLVGQSIQWQRDAEIKLLKLRAATIEECAKAVEDISDGWIARRIRALKEQK